MKTAYMGNGDIVVSCLSHKNFSRLIIFSKAKHRLPLLPLTEEVNKKDIGEGMFQIYFAEKENLKRFIDNLNMIYEDWE